VRTIHHHGNRLLAGVAPLALIAAAFAATPATAQSAADFAEMRQQIAEMKAQQAAASARIAQLETQLAATATVQPQATPTQLAAAPAQAPSVASPSSIVTFASQQPASPASPINPAGGSGPGASPTALAKKLALSGDIRVRYESNSGDEDARNRDRGVLRARLRASYAINNWLTIGGQLTTGDPNDPNSTDVTLTGFDNDLMVSLDQAYIRGQFGNLQVNAGKIQQPFVRTELVWDGDVSQEGVSAAYRMDLGEGASLKATGLYFFVDESPTLADSHMIGGQVQFESAAGKPVRFELAAGYYDYALRSLANGDIGDFRTNRFAGGRYLSDFNLLNVIGAVTYNGLGESWPLRVVGDYVHNFGATTSEDSGFGVDLLVGRTVKRHDLRFGYGYAQVGVDGVLAAFSHDNTDLATNYIQHTALIDYTIAPNVILNGTIYHYKPKSPLFTPGFLPDDWINRVRLNLLVNF
jgi:hypothetical protein